MKRAAQLLVFALCVVFTVTAFINVFSDNTEVEQMAKAVACEGMGSRPLPPTAPPGMRPAECPLTRTRMMRTPIAQSFEFTGKGTTKGIRCARSLVLVGSYECKAE